MYSAIVAVIPVQSGIHAVDLPETSILGQDIADGVLGLSCLIQAACAVHKNRKGQQPAGAGVDVAGRIQGGAGQNQGMACRAQHIPAAIRIRD